MKVALVGIGKIAVDQHVPAIANSPDWELAATVSRSGTVDGVQAFTDFATMLINGDFADADESNFHQCESLPTAEPRLPFRKSRSAPVSAPCTCF
jgi:hypothetical protein